MKKQYQPIYIRTFIHTYIQAQADHGYGASAAACRRGGIYVSTCTYAYTLISMPARE